MKVRPGTACAYCGRVGIPLEKEHVIPKCLYPPSKHGSKVQRITVPACAECNRGFCDDETHFRNMLLISGMPNHAVMELWRDKAVPSLSKEDGMRRVAALFNQMNPITVGGENRFVVYPHEDPHVARVLRKVVRGLSHFHGLGTAISDTQVVIQPAVYQIPKSLYATLTLTHREQDILRYGFSSVGWDDVTSFWHLTFFDRRAFFGVVLDPTKTSHLLSTGGE